MGWAQKLWVTIGCSLLLCSPQTGLAEEKPATSRPLSVGLMPYLSTRTLLTNYQPIAVALETALKQPVQLGRWYTVQLLLD